MAWDDTPPDQGSSGWDSEPPKPGEIPQWSDMKNNFLPDAENIAKGAVGTAERIGKGVLDLPKDTAETIKDEWGGNFTNTPIAQDIKTVGGGIADAITGIPQQLGNLASKDAWIQHPAQNALTAGSILAPMLSPETEGMAASIGKGAGNLGGSMATDLAETSANTIKKLNPEALGEEAQGNIRTVGNKPNLQDVRNELGKKLVKEDVVGGVGQDIGDRSQEANVRQDTFGKQVRSSIDAIKSKGIDASVDSKTVLEPLLNKYVELGDSSVPATARPYGDLYSRLEKMANGNNGKLTFEMIDSELHDPGLKEAFKKTADSKAYETAKTKYAILADARDNVVQQIAKQANDPKIATNLMDANKGYSLYSRVAKDMETPAAAGGTGGAPNPNRALYRGAPIRATIYAGIRAIKPALAEALVKGGPKFAKIGGYLEAMAKQGPRNFLMADMLLRQQNKDYANLTQ